MSAKIDPVEVVVCEGRMRDLLHRRGGEMIFTSCVGYVSTNGTCIVIHDYYVQGSESK